MADIDKQPLSPDIIQHNAHASPVEQEAPDRETDPGPGVADRAHGDLAADAAAHLERSGYSLQSFGGDPEAIERQAACLSVWARAKGLVLADEYTAHLFSHVPITADWEALRLGRQAHDGLPAGRLNKPGFLRKIVVWNERSVT